MQLSTSIKSEDSRDVMMQTDDGSLSIWVFEGVMNTALLPMTSKLIWISAPSHFA